MTWQRVLPVAMVFTVAALGAACGGDEPDAAEPERDGEGAATRHAQCMRDHGIDWADPVLVDGEWRSEPGDGVDLESPAFVEAEETCAQELQDSRPGSGDALDPADRAALEEEMEAMLDFAQCMRDEGIDFPDPQFDDAGGIDGPAGPPDGDSDAFDAAREVCEAEAGRR